MPLSFRFNTSIKFDTHRKVRSTEEIDCHCFFVKPTEKQLRNVGQRLASAAVKKYDCNGRGKPLPYTG